MKILVINCGSSSLKYQLLDMTDESVLCKGSIERIGLKINGGEENVIVKVGDEKFVYDKELKDHVAAFNEVKYILSEGEHKVIDSFDEIDAIGHRIVQGGDRYTKSVLVTEKVVKDVEELAPLAPLHNPAHLMGYRACLKVVGPDVPQVFVFDTSFHSTMPPKAYMYAVPYEYYEKYAVRRYGFHGTSHRYVSHRCAELMGQDLKDLKMITCHLGNGSSISAIQDGKVIDTSMGLTPLDGFMMGSRTGTLDPSVVTFVMEKENITPHDMSEMLNKKSGMLGISGVSSDDRDVTKAAREGNPRAILAHEMLEYEITKFIGAYAAALNGCDVIVFTAGLGENQAHHRQVIGDGLTYLGVKIDPQLNEEMIRGKEGLISTPDSKVKVYVIPTNEELVIARDTKEIVEAL